MVTTAPKDPIDQFLDKLPSNLMQEIIGNDSEALGRRLNLVSKGSEALRILKAKKAVLTNKERPIIRAGLVVDFLCRQGLSFRQTSIPTQTLSDLLGVKKRKDIEQMQALICSHLESSFQKSSSRQGQKRKQSSSLANKRSESQNESQILGTNLVRDLCIRLGPIISNAELAASYAQRLFDTLANNIPGNSTGKRHSRENRLIMDDISRNTEYYEAACLFLAVQKIEGTDDSRKPISWQPSKATNKKDPKGLITSKEDSDEDNIELDVDDDRALTRMDIINTANLREGMFNDTLAVVSDYIQDVSIPIPMNTAVDQDSSIMSQQVSSTAAAADASNPSKKRRMVSETFEKWKQDTLEGKADDLELLQMAADEVLRKYDIA